MQKVMAVCCFHPRIQWRDRCGSTAFRSPETGLFINLTIKILGCQEISFDCPENNGVDKIAAPSYLFQNMFFFKLMYQVSGKAV
jgi:hypothetical protein